jgi:hypothetical protein
VLDLSLADVGPARRLGWDREVDAVAGQLGEDVRLEPVDEPAAQLDLGARELAGECPAAQTAQAIRLLPQLPAPARRRLTSFGGDPTAMLNLVKLRDPGTL